jgi:hypothetical protein
MYQVSNSGHCRGKAVLYQELKTNEIRIRLAAFLFTRISLSDGEALQATEGFFS